MLAPLPYYHPALLKMRLMHPMAVIFLILWLCNGITCKRNTSLKPRATMPETFKLKEMRPPGTKGHPVVVEFSIYVVDVNSINVEDMDFRVDMFIRATWRESRIQLPEDMFEDGDDHVTLPQDFFDNLWHPDPYFPNSKLTEIAELTHKFSSVTLYKNHTVRYAARMYAIIACQMEFQYYPMDIQSCPIYIESFSYTNKKVRFRWGEAGVTVNPDLKLLQYHIWKPLRLEETNGYMMDKDGNHSRLVVYFKFERQIGHHLIQTFAPSTLVVMLSWFSFWLELDAIPGRVTLLMTCMLTLVTMFTGLRADIPPVAYVKALDLWMAGCMLFVFAALSEFVLIKVLDSEYKASKNNPEKVNPVKGSCGTVAAWDGTGVRCNMLDIASPTSPGTAVGHPSVPTSPNNVAERRLSRVPVSWVDSETGQERITWREIERHSRYVFPGCFFVFLVVYWPVLLFHSKTPST